MHRRGSGTRRGLRAGGVALRTPPASSGAPPAAARDDVRREARVVTGATLLYGALFFDRLAPLYLVAVMAGDLAIPWGTAGLLPLGIGVGWAVAMLLSQRVSRWLAPRERMLVAAGITAVLGLASAAATGWAGLVLLRSLAGVASGLAAPAVTTLTYAVAPAHRRGRDLGLVQSSTRLFGSLASPVAVTWVAVLAGWRPALVVSACFLAVSAVAFAVLTAGERPAVGDRGPRPAAAAPLLRRGGLVHVAICTLVAVVLLTWLVLIGQGGGPLLTAWLGIGTDTAGRIIGAFGLGAWIAALGVPVMSDHVGRRAALVGATATGGASGLLLAWSSWTDLALPQPLVAVLFGLAGVAMGALPLVLSIVPAEAVARGDVGQALRVPIVTGELVGGALLPAIALAGWVSEAVSIAVVAAALLAASAASLQLRPLA